jgi:GNAT superfamily N-acetyltransferase
VEVEVRPAEVGDLGAMVRLLGVLFSVEADFRPDPVRQRRGLVALMGDPVRRRAWVADRDGAVVGMVTGQLLVSTAEGGGSVLVEDLVVEAAERGRGVGRRLLQAVSDWARLRGATRLQLLADRDNGPAVAFYARLGWTGTRLVALRRAP